MKALLMVAVLILLGGALFSADWPTYMFDNQRSGASSEKLELPLNLKWKFDSSASPAAGWAMPLNGYGAFKTKPNVSFDDAYQVIAADGILYFASSGENCVYALDAGSGKVLWTFFTESSPRQADRNVVDPFACLENLVDALILQHHRRPEIAELCGCHILHAVSFFVIAMGRSPKPPQSEAAWRVWHQTSLAVGTTNGLRYGRVSNFRYTLFSFNISHYY